MTWLAVALAALWLWLAWHDLRAVRALPDLPPLPPGARERDVTIVLAVRDDGARIAEAVEGLLAQTGVAAKLVVVDDRSSDETPTVLAGLANAEPRLDVRRVDTLPPDWIGKSHALERGAHDVGTRWILFTDSDARLAADTLARAIDAAEREGAQHVCLLPTHRHTSLLGKAALLAFHLQVQRRVFAVNRDRTNSFVGTGAFHLVRTDAYRAIGGHEPLRLEVVDDVWLGCLLQRRGYRTRVWLAERELSIDWGGTPLQLVKVVEKNMFAVLRFHTALAMTLALIAPTIVLLSLTAPLWCGAVGWLPLAAYLTTGAAGVALARRMRWNLVAGALVPIARLMLPIALWNSTWSTLRRGGVAWRGTFYPLEQLRRGQVR